jgi:putative phage-type endonuclease
MLISELEDLDNILESLVFYDEPSIFTEEYAVDFVETALYLMDEYINIDPHIISEPQFKEILIDEIKDIFSIQIEDQIDSLYNNTDDIEDEMNDLLEDALEIFINTFYPNTSNIIKEELNTNDLDIIEKKINNLREKPQPVQRTEEWYQFRWNLITASNAWKAFESQSTINQLIYEKCLPLKSLNEDIDNFEVKMVNINSPLHWGQKYEPISVLIYQDKYKTEVEDFGCIQHNTFKFLGASPDGIVINKDSDRFGRMLEIKNVVSREINGIPKKEYWTQMQLQMEVCDLDECDFLETKFIEYPDRDTFQNDSSNTIFYNNQGCKYNNNFLSKDDKIKGEIIYFHTKEGKPFYKYKPLNYILNYKVEEWESQMIDIYENEPYNYTYIKTIYWKLEVFSCILVMRNREWFKNNINQLEKVWKIIEEERITGYQHRAPVKKTKADYSKSYENNNLSQGCLLKFDKIIKL